MTNEHISNALQYLDDDLLMETHALRKSKTGGPYMTKKFSILIAAVLIAALCCVTASATISGGWFSDVTNAFGAVTGTEYHNATEELTVSLQAEGGLLTVTVTAVDPTVFPYREIAFLSIGQYTITDSSGNPLCEGTETPSAAITDGTACLQIPAGDLSPGEYTLHIANFVGEKKADAPLPIYGDWTCPFTVE